LNAVFAGNHYDLESFTPEQAARLSFVELQVRTTRNYAGGVLAHYLCGGLEHQIEHHLFPRLPRHELMRAGSIVKEFCAEHGLPYQETSFWRSLAQVAAFHTAQGPLAAGAGDESPVSR
jgi:fatty acid desaturase